MSKRMQNVLTQNPQSLWQRQLTLRGLGPIWWSGQDTFSDMFILLTSSLSKCENCRRKKTIKIGESRFCRILRKEPNVNT